MQRGFQSRDGELIHAQRAEKRIAADAVHDFFFACDDSRLRTAQQFISAESETSAGFATGARDGFGNSIGREIGDAAGAEIFVHGKMEAFAQRDQFRERRALGESSDAEIRRMHAQEQAGAIGDGAFVVAEARAIGGADFAELARRFRP